MKLQVITPPPVAKEYVLTLTEKEARALRAITQLDRTVPHSLRQYPALSSHADTAAVLMSNINKALTQELYE